MNILLLGAAGKIGKLLTENLLAQTRYNLVLYARNADTRLKAKKSERVRLVDGDFNRSLGVSEPDTDWNKPSFY